MKSKEKAIELIKKYSEIVLGEDENGNDVFMTIKELKQCALICVDEEIKLIQSLKHPMNTALSNRRLDRKVDELLEVKQELEKL